ncbi:MAG: phosphatase PAP2 family protein [Acidithiobacillales bacterium]
MKPVIRIAAHREEAATAEDALLRRLSSIRPLPHEAVSAVYMVVGILALERLPVTYPRSAILLAFADKVAFVGGLALVAIAARRLLFRRAEGRPDPTPVRLESLIVLRSVLCLLPVLSLHFLIKSFIHLLNPRMWDLSLLQWDRFFFLGLSPSLFFTGLFNQPSFLHAIDIVYSFLYALIVVGSCGAFLSLLPPARRLAFTAAWAFLWIAGSLLYVALPSWGPVFVVPQIFEGVLQKMPETVGVQSVLFREIASLVAHPYSERLVRFGSVAAFPSLHLGAITVITLASRGVSRTWFVLNGLFVLLMLIGSVVTGYHYLVDGWAGILLGLGVWKAGRLLTRKWEPGARPLPSGPGRAEETS